jgi:TM2 domain-containing membrane protein YozV
MTAERRRCATQLSFWLPGLGQLYLCRWRRGTALLALSWITSDLAWNGCSAAWSLAAVAVWIVAVRDVSRWPRRLTDRG